MPRITDLLTDTVPNNEGTSMRVLSWKLSVVIPGTGVLVLMSAHVYFRVAGKRERGSKSRHVFMKYQTYSYHMRYFTGIFYQSIVERERIELDRM